MNWNKSCESAIHSNEEKPVERFEVWRKNELMNQHYNPVDISEDGAIWNWLWNTRQRKRMENDLKRKGTERRSWRLKCVILLHIIIQNLRNTWWKWNWLLQKNKKPCWLQKYTERTDNAVNSNQVETIQTGRISWMPCLKKFW